MPYAKRNGNQRKAQWKEKRCLTATLLTLGIAHASMALHSLTRSGA